MLEDIGNEHVLTLEVDRGEDLVQQLPRLADERLSLLILVRAGRLADAHEVGVGIPYPGDRVDRRRVELAATTTRHDVRDLLQRIELRRGIVEQRAARTAHDESGGHVGEW